MSGSPITRTIPRSAQRWADVVVVGAGVVGAACAYYAARAGLRVAVVDRGSVAGGTTSAGEGNLLISDKEPGPELALTLRSLALWHELGSTLDGAAFELEPKGGLVVAATGAELVELRRLADQQRAAGVTALDVEPDGLAELEPHLAQGFAGGAAYPQDTQVQPMLAVAHLLRAAVTRYVASLHLGAEVTAITRAPDSRVTTVDTTQGSIATPVVVNAAGTWAGEVAALAGVALPILPRRGFILVTQPLPPLVRHKVYAADYMSTVASDDSELQVSAVVEHTKSGTVLIGASRERVGYDRTFRLPVLSRLASGAIELFPILAGVQILRAYLGFRPYCPDHLPVIGADPRVPGLLHACGHEGAGIGLAPATGELIAAALTGASTVVDPTPFAPTRFVGDAHV